MAQAKTGDTVKVHYTGKLDDGTQFDSSEGQDPLEFTIGEGQVIEGFENGVIGMQADERKTLTIPFLQAYGPHREEWVIDVPRADFPEGIDPQVGMQLEMQQEDGHVIEVVISDVSDEFVQLDANHPLAGEDLTFDLHLVSIG